MINKKYFKYLSKSLLSLIIVCAVIGVMALGFFPALSFRSVWSYASNVQNYTYTEALSSYFGILIAIAYAVPFVIHSRYYSKNSSDIYLSLPMNRKQAFVTENLFGLIIVVGSVLLGFATGLAFTALQSLAPNYSLMETYGQIFQSLPIMLLTVITVYMMSAVAVSISNSMIEASFVVVSISAICVLLWGVVELFFYDYLTYTYYYQEIGFSYSPLIAYSMFGDYGYYADGPYNGNNPVSYGYRWYGEGLLSLGINFVIWAGLLFFAYTRFIKMKSEHLGTASMEPFAGPDAHATAFGFVFIFIGALITLAIKDGGFLQFLVVIAVLGVLIAYWVSVFILRRKIVFRKDDLIRFAISSLGGIAIGVILYLMFVRQ